MQRGKFLIGGLLILGAVIYLIVSSAASSAQFFMTVEELKAKSADLVDRNITVSGAVIGDTIVFSDDGQTITFEVAQVSADNDEIAASGGLAVVLHQAVTNTNSARMKVTYIGPKPDLLRNEAQAIMTGHLGSDGVFYADELLLKCPTKYEQSVPNQVNGN
jgi:cytochrome c-type biogenesis protein CcmE